MKNDFHFPGGKLADLLLEATHFPRQFSLSYPYDLKYLFVRRWTDLLEGAGIPVLRQPLSRYKIKDARIIENITIPPSSSVHCKSINARFCFAYGLSDHSFDAINFRNRFKELPKHFIHAEQSCSLGNIAIGVDAPISEINIYPPPEISLCGIAEAPIGKTRSMLAWLGVHFIREFIDQNIVNQVEAIDDVFTQAHPMTVRFQANSYGDNRYIQSYAKGPWTQITAEEERILRKSYGYPEKGKTGMREKMLYDSACMIFGSENVIRHYRGAEMERLEIDVWIPDVKIALEYQGEQHSKHIPHWHGENGFDDQKKRDARKIMLCKKLGYRLMLFGPKDNLDFVSLLARFREQWWI